MTEDQVIDRRSLLALAAGAAIAPRMAAAQSVALRPNLPGPYDLVINGGRAIDPESGLDAIRNIGITAGRIVAISEAPLEGARTLEAEGQIVAPGFIDLHAHGQQMAAAWVQAFDGVTTGLELESGLLPISMYYENTAKEGRTINYGAGAAQTFARVEAKEGAKPDGTIEFFQKAFALQNWQNTIATDEELEQILGLVDAGLREGGLGISINAGYAPGYGRKEYYELAKLAARRNVPTFTHVRYLSVIEPLSSFEAIEELVALSAITGAHMHICHLNSTSVRDIAACAGLVKDAIDRGLRVTTEAYPYGAASSTIGAEIFRGNWLERQGADVYSSLELNGQPLNQQEIERLQASEPGSVVVMHWARPDDNEEDQKILDQSVLFPGGAIASDAMPWTDASGNLINDDVWPLPEDAYAHPRSSACFTRFLKRWAHDRNAIGLSDALAKCALIPARIMEEAVPQMRTKGRLQVGMDADLVVFDLANLKDNANFMEPAALSSGYRHVIVNGTPIIEEGARMGDRHPGRPVRRVL